MSEMMITLPSGHTISFQQMVLIDRLGKSLGLFEWHVNQCGCCVTVHPKGQHDRGYVIDRDGGSEWVGSPMETL